jgi:hypothetical protein
MLLSWVAITLQNFAPSGNTTYHRQARTLPTILERKILEQGWQIEVGQHCPILHAHILHHRVPSQEMGSEEDR